MEVEEEGGGKGVGRGAGGDLVFEPMGAELR